MTAYLNLKTIHLSHNYLTDFEQLSALPALEALLLKDNNIAALPVFEKGVAFVRLKLLDLSRNRLTELPALALGELCWLSAAENEIKRVEGLQELPQLTWLDLSRNNIVDCSNIRDSPALQTLVLRHNKIRVLPHLASLPALQCCNLRGNHLSVLDADALTAPSLEQLNLRGNRLEKREELRKLLGLEGLRKLSLRENPVWEKDAEGCGFEMAVELRSLIRVDKVDVGDAFLEAMHAWQEQKWREETLQTGTESEVAEQSVND